MSQYSVALPLIQAVHAGVSGLKTVPAQDSAYPSSITRAGAPWALTYPGAGFSQEFAKNAFKDERLWVVEVYYHPVGASGNHQDPRIACGELLANMKQAWHDLTDNEAYWLDYGTVSGYRIAFMRTEPIRDTGVSSQMYHDDENELWWGFQFMPSISIQWGDAIC